MLPSTRASHSAKPGEYMRIGPLSPCVGASSGIASIAPLLVRQASHRGRAPDKPCSHPAARAQALGLALSSAVLTVANGSRRGPPESFQISKESLPTPRLIG